MKGLTGHMTPWSRLLLYHSHTHASTCLTLVSFSCWSVGRGTRWRLDPHVYVPSQTSWISSLKLESLLHCRPDCVPRHSDAPSFCLELNTEYHRIQCWCCLPGTCKALDSVSSTTLSLSSWEVRNDSVTQKVPGKVGHAPGTTSSQKGT